MPSDRYITTSGHIMAGNEEKYVHSAVKGKTLSGGKWCNLFASSLKNFMKFRHISLCNSGSSANLLALSALTSPKLGPRHLKRGDRVITVAAGFPTTAFPIYQLGLEPIFVDVELGTLNIDVTQLEDTLKYNPKALMIAHTLGNPFNVREVQKFCIEHQLWIVEDCCDALGSEWEGRHVGSFGHFATFSFYPAHHITTGEGGAVATPSPRLHKILNSFRDWGRDCWCLPGKENTCSKRFDHEFEHLPKGYDHKYVYSYLGYNMKMSEMQAAFGTAQLEKLAEWRVIRQRNYVKLYHSLEKYVDFFVLPYWHPKASINPFGFPLTVKSSAPFNRSDIIKYLEANGVATRPLFGGNLIRQPAFDGKPMQLVNLLPNTGDVVANTFWFGCWHGLGIPQMKYISVTIDMFMEKYV